MPAFLIAIPKVIGSLLSTVWLPIFLELLKRLNTERNIRRAVVLLVRWLEEKSSHPKVKEALDIIADAWEVPELSYKAQDKPKA